MFKPLPQVLQVQRLATRLGRTRRPLRPTLESRISTTSPLSNALISAPLHARRQMPIKTDMASQETPNGVVKDAVKDVQIKGAGGKVLPEPYNVPAHAGAAEARETLRLDPGGREAGRVTSCAESMCLVHDLAEAYVGDITPVEGVPASVKHELEEKAMSAFLDEMLGGPSNAQARERFRSLWEEYEARETPESKLVKDLDRLELVLQGVEYERGKSLSMNNEL
ncbi:hypothetical protein A1Q1_02187 [Trichosporon asahii var. asahii CBS 2479]|uniref:HD domain-containing protein n=1 Tax=Trichosporon asahii var. asahii (strain ATCC 90039 / CBS 2479 / JCM 2466 / KCTC 7840 / NBRC 103889/ NCYC 2677 / UAMH 7654) TaxID=1186058 RepID=J6F114_TRIAS|nr:hypothetical protein A1Q1_02187 [Trichosporon asahii var. asahii CBS 2479]EJT48852.1 hypothetical protein A1Q1_02187 [Trichosporon asahii var. asahii CBS 2479]